MKITTATVVVLSLLFTAILLSLVGITYAKELSCTKVRTYKCWKRPSCRKKKGKEAKMNCIKACKLDLFGRLQECLVKANTNLRNKNTGMAQCKDNLRDVRGKLTSVLDRSEVLRLSNPTPSYDDHFGSAVAMNDDGSRIVISAHLDDTGPSNSGSVYLFDGSGVLLSTIKNPNPQAGDMFGTCVAMNSDGTRILVGSLYEYNSYIVDAGAAYLFDDNGSLLQTFHSPTPSGEDHFGKSVAISSDGTRILVGAPGKNDDVADLGGAVYLFNDDGELNHNFTSPYPERDDYFGTAVAMDGDGTKLLVGANNFAGIAYLFVEGTADWSLNHTFYNPQSDDNFGQSLAMSGDGTRVIVGAENAVASGTQLAGAAYLYNADIGTYIHTFNHRTPSWLGGFGFAVAMSNDGTKLLISALYEGYESLPLAPEAGAAYLYNETGALLKMLHNPSPSDYDYFGTAVAMSGDGSKLVVGADGHETGAKGEGEAYVFNYAPGFKWTEP